MNFKHEAQYYFITHEDPSDMSVKEAIKFIKDFKPNANVKYYLPIFWNELNLFLAPDTHTHPDDPIHKIIQEKVFNKKV